MPVTACRHQPPDSNQRAQAPRLLALDAFRGLDMLAMLLVATAFDPAYFPDQLRHRGWNDGTQGATFCDLIFPWFLFIVGVAIPYSMESGRGRECSIAMRLFSAARRGLVLYLLGCLIHAARTGNVTLLTWDILQHIGAAYLIAVVVYHLPPSGKVGFVAVVLLAKYALLRWIPIPGVGEVVWTPEQNMQRWLTASYLGWFGALQNVLPGSTVVVMGMMAGAWLRRKAQAHAAAVGGLLLGGISLVTLSWLWQLDFPYSKDYFTSSYALLGAGTGCLLLALLYWVCDVRRLTRAAVFVIPGRNAIAMYVAMSILSPMVLHRWRLAGDTRTLAQAFTDSLAGTCGGMAAAWLYTAAYVGIGWLLTYSLHRRGAYLKV
ncbi:MAG: DUF1624 domain-containing protein [Phycisphaerales bacterium]|nr:DUF1624 domain-containing protein [Phycisphaerales bacterium]